MRRRSKTRYATNAQRYGIKAKIASLIVLKLILFFQGCATTQKSLTSTEQSIYTGLCLEGEGKGRITQKSNRKLFSFQSHIDLTQKIWKLGIDIPLNGEEILILKVIDDKLHLEGSFVKKLDKLPRKDKILWKDMMEMLKMFLLSLDGSVGAEGYKVLMMNNGDRKITFAAEKSKMELHLYNQMQRNDFLEKIDFQYFPDQMTEKSELSLLLFTNECQNVLSLSAEKR